MLIIIVALALPTKFWATDLLSNVISAQQQITVTGTVIDEFGDPLPGVSILLQGSSAGTVTDSEGNYSITVPNSAAILRFTFIGFKTETVTVGEQRRINMTLLEDTQQLGEVVVTALGLSKEKKKLGYSVTEIKAKELSVTSGPTFANALQGRVAGLAIDQSAGGPLGSSRIQIRGNTTLTGNNQPIFVIDGVIIENTVSNGNRDFGNSLKNLNMEDYETISVLKGSAASALYGSRALNGVIVITTKKGKKASGLGVNVSQSLVSFNPYKGPQFQNEFGGGSVGAFFTDWRDPGYKSNENWRTTIFPTNAAGEPYIDRQIGREAENWGPRFNGQQVRNYDGTWTTWEAKPNNYMDCFENGLRSLTNISIEGGSEAITFRLSYTHDDNKGITYGAKGAKDVFNLRSTYDINKYIGLDVGTDYTVNTIKNPTPTSFGSDFMWTYPRNFDTRYWMKPENYTGVHGGLPQTNDADEPNKAPALGAFFSLFENANEQVENALRSRIAMNIKPTEWMRVVLEGNINNLYMTREGKNMGTGKYYTGGEYNIRKEQKKDYNLKGMVVLNKSFENFNIDGLVGAETFRARRLYSYMRTDGGLRDPGRFYIANSINPIVAENNLDYNKQINSLYAGLNVDWRSQLFLSFTWRSDWSSTLVKADGSGYPAYNYPSASFSWVFTETFHLPRLISFGKLRANITSLGNDWDPYKINVGYKFDGDAFDPNTGTRPKKVGYTEKTFMPGTIKSEKMISKEIGLDMKFFENRFGFDISWYRDNTYDQIFTLPTPRESGVPNIYFNAGNIQNTGIELTVDYTPVRTRDFEWSGAFNFNNNRNKIVKLYEGRDEYSLPGGIHTMNSYAIVNGSYGTIRTNAASKPFQATDAAGNAIDHRNNGLPEFEWRADARCAFLRRSNEWQDIGDINPKFRGGLLNTLRYKNWSFMIHFDARLGGDMVSYSYSFGTHTGLLPHTLVGRDAAHGGITWTSAWDGETYDDGIIPHGVFQNNQMVSQPGGGSVNVGGMTYQEAYDAGYVEPTHIAQYYYRTGSWSTGTTDYWVFKNSWIALRSLALTYDFPKSLCSSLHIKGLNLSIYANDLCYLYNSLPYDFNPASINSNRTSAIGEEGFLPMIRQFGGTVRVSF